jgi:endonuclease YncB( thermonuclease family)
MRNCLKIILLLITFLLILPTLSLSAQLKVTRVYDGDTVKGKGHDIEIKVRLVGIDAPETSRKKRDPGQPYSQQAKKYLAGLILNRTVDIKGYGLDRYNRILGVIYLDGRNINLEMVKAGLAEVYRGSLQTVLILRHMSILREKQEKPRRACGVWETSTYHPGIGAKFTNEDEHGQIVKKGALKWRHQEK